MNNKQDKGFTLVELLIVIVILGILATVTVFAVRGITDKGQENACKTERREIETAFEAYYAANNQTDADAWADISPSYLKSDPSPRWAADTVTVAGVTSWVAPPAITGTGDCSGW